MAEVTGGSPHFKSALWVLLGAALAVGLVLRFGGSSLELDHWLASGQQELATHKTLLARDAAHVARAAAARRRLTDSLDVVLQVVKAQQEGGAALLASARSAEQYKAAGEVLARSGQVCVDALTLCRTRGDSLARADSVHTDSLRVALRGADTTIARGVHLVECHLIHAGPIKLFGCPSRTQAFELGAVVGILGTLVLTHR